MPTRLLQDVIDSPLGAMLAIVVVRDDDAGTVAMLEFTDRPRLTREVPELVKAFGVEPLSGRASLHESVELQLGQYFARERSSFDIPLETPGTEFQRRVWGALRSIPYGETRSYGELAQAIAAPGAQRAVGAANGANRVAIVIPCHRVIESGGGLRGYGGGLERKRALLELEGAWPPGPGLFDEVLAAGDAR